MQWEGEIFFYGNISSTIKKKCLGRDFVRPAQKEVFHILR